MASTIEAEWTVATGKGTARRRRRKIDRKNQEDRRYDHPRGEEDNGEDRCHPSEKLVSRHVSMVQVALNDVKHSMYGAHIVRVWNECVGKSVGCCSLCDRIVVWGLGSLEQPGAYTIRCQLGLALILRDILVDMHSEAVREGKQSRQCAVEMYDPVFTSLDRAVLQGEYGCIIPDTNNNGRVVINTPTLMYMPHCESDLTLTFLETNLNHGTLGNVVMLGNSLHASQERCELTSVDPLGHKSLYSRLRTNLVLEISLPELGFDCPGAFNNLSLHFF